jgi:hypothetical protein
VLAQNSVPGDRKHEGTPRPLSRAALEPSQCCPPMGVRLHYVKLCHATASAGIGFIGPCAQTGPLRHDQSTWPVPEREFHARRQLETTSRIARRSSEFLD